MAISEKLFREGDFCNIDSKHRFSTLDEKDLALYTKVDVVASDGTQGWKSGRYIAMGVTGAGRIRLGHRASGNYVGSMSPHCPDLTIVNEEKTK